MKKKDLNRFGFTLMEMLVVIIIVGVLSTIALPMYNKAVIKSRAAQARIIARQVVLEMEEFYTLYGRYPANYGEFTSMLNFPGISCHATNCASNKTSGGPCKCDVGNYSIFYKGSSKDSYNIRKQTMVAIYNPNSADNPPQTGIGAGFFMDLSKKPPVGLSYSPCVVHKNSKWVSMCKPNSSVKEFGNNDSMYYYPEI